MNQLLNWVLAMDGALAVGFGLISFFFPQVTYATIVDLDTARPSLTLSALDSLSVFYVLIGLVCLLGPTACKPVRLALAAVMIVRHLWIGTLGFMNAEQPWIIGNPWSDIGIHALFVGLYVLGVFFVARRSSADNAASCFGSITPRLRSGGFG